MHNRENALKDWLTALDKRPFQLMPLTGDASFRRYFRLKYQNESRIVMDAPPEKESLESFIQVRRILFQKEILSPQIYAINKEQGFLVLEDFKDELLLHTLSADNADFYYDKAINNLLKMQKNEDFIASLPIFDSSFMVQEMKLCQTWFLEQHLSLALTGEENRLLSDAIDWISRQVLEQPHVFIHRDYHSRNLMIVNQELGVIDFQDAMLGPLCYDLVSLLKDCYISWPRTKVLHWANDFYQRSQAAKNLSPEAFIRCFDLCGLQRHLKVLGVFSRLHLRDNKPGYLKDLPLVLAYVFEAASLFPQLSDFYHFLKNRVYLS